MNPLFFISIFVGLGVLYSVIGYYASLHVKTNTDYFLAGKKLGFVSVVSTLIATQLGGAMLLGTSQWAYDYGFYGILYCLGASLGFLFLASGIASRLQSSGAVTVAELFELRYGSVFLRKSASLISIISLWGLLVMIVVASRSLIVSIDGLNDWSFIIFWLSVVLYTMIGGLQAVVATDKIQLPFIITILVSVFFYSIWYMPLGLYSLQALFERQGDFIIPNLSSSYFFGILLMPALFALIEQDLAQCFFAARSKRVALTAAFVAALVIVAIGMIPVYCGMQVRLLGLVSDKANPLVVFLEYIMSEHLFVVAICGIVAAIVSTADTLLCALGSNLIQDFGNIFGRMGNYVTISKIVTCTAGISALIASYVVTDSIIVLAINSYELSVSCLLIPLLYALYESQKSKYAAFGAAAMGLFGFVFFRAVPPPFSREVLTLMLSWAGYWLGSYIVI